MFHGPVPVLHRLQQYLIKLKACLHPKFLVTPRATLLFFSIMEAHDPTGGGTVETDSKKIITKSDEVLLAMQPFQLLAWAKKSVMKNKNDRTACNLIIEKMFEIANKITFETTSEPVPFYPANILDALPALLENVSESSKLYYNIFSGRIRHGKDKEKNSVKKFHASQLKLLVQFQGPVFLDFFKDERKKARTEKQGAAATETESQAATGGDASFAKTGPEPFDRPLQLQGVVPETQDDSALPLESTEQTVTRLKSLIRTRFLTVDTEEQVVNAANGCLKMMTSEGAEICNREDLVKILCKNFVSRKINLRYKDRLANAPAWQTEESKLMDHTMGACVAPAGISDFDQILNLEFKRPSTRQTSVPDSAQMDLLAMHMIPGCKYLLKKLLESEGKSTGAATAADPPSTSAAASSTGQAPTPALSPSEPATAVKPVSGGMPSSSSSGKGKSTDKAQEGSSIPAKAKTAGEHVQMELVNVSRQFADAKNMKDVSQLFNQFCTCYIEEDTEMTILQANAAVHDYLTACCRLQSSDGKTHGDKDQEIAWDLTHLSTDERQVGSIHSIIEKQCRMLSAPQGVQVCTEIIMSYLSYWRASHQTKPVDFCPESLMDINSKDLAQMIKIELCFKQRFDTATCREEIANVFGQFWKLYMTKKSDMHTSTLDMILHRYITKAFAESIPYGVGPQNLKELSAKQLEKLEQDCRNKTRDLRDPIKIHDLLFPVQAMTDGYKLTSYENIEKLAKALRYRFFSVKSALEDEAKARAALDSHLDSAQDSGAKQSNVKKGKISSSSTSDPRRTQKRARESPAESSAESALREQNEKWWREVGEPKRQRGLKMLEKWKKLTPEDIPFLKGKH